MNDLTEAAEPEDEPAAQSPAQMSGWWRRLTHRLVGGPNSRDDVLELIDGAHEDGLIDAEAAQMIRGVFETGEQQVRDIMVPRAQMSVVEADWPLPKILAYVIEAGHSRFPVIGESRDDIRGILLAKDLLRLAGGDTQFELERWLRPAVFVPESKRVNRLLNDFRGSRNHMAIVIDEYGGNSGLVTIEDVLEQIVGEIDDEHDETEGAPIVRQDDKHFLVNALTPIEDFNAYFDSDLADAEFDTVGGLVVNAFGHLPRRGEQIGIDRFQFQVQRADGRRVQLLLVTL
jgi:magnesium and cobalt transporter